MSHDYFHFFHISFQAFKNYRLQEKPPKFEEKGNVEAEFLNIQTKLKANKMK